MKFIDVYQTKIYDGLTNNILVIMGYVPLTDLETPPLSPQKWWPQKVVMKGAKCAELKGIIDKKNSPILFFELSSKIGVIFSQKMTIT